jgi:hypothetical protein
MPGREKARKSGDDLVERVAAIAGRLGLLVHREVKVGRRVWGAERFIDVVLTNPLDRKRIGIECKAQETKGSAEEKIPTTIQDIRAWPIEGLVVFSGEGMSRNMTSFLLASGKAVHVGDLESWLRLFFGLDIAP